MQIERLRKTYTEKKGGGGVEIKKCMNVAREMESEAFQICKNISSDEFILESLWMNELRSPFFS